MRKIARELSAVTGTFYKAFFFIWVMVRTIRCIIVVENSNEKYTEEAKEASAMSAAVYGPYSPVVRAGDFIFVSGQLGHIDPATGGKNEGIESQTRQCLENIQALLKGIDALLDDVVKTTVFLKNAGDFSMMNETYAQYFKGRKPTRATVVVGLLSPDMLIEIECMAYCPK